MRRLLVMGAGGHGKVCADIAIKMKKWDRIVFLDDKEGIKECMGFPVIDKLSAALCYRENTDYFVAIGDNGIREQIQDKLGRGFFGNFITSRCSGWVVSKDRKREYHYGRSHY